MGAPEALLPRWQGLPFRPREYGLSLALALLLFVLAYPAYVLTDARLFTRPWVDGQSSEFAFYPWDRFIAERLRVGEIPLWNPREAGGTPFVANYQSSLFFPLKLLLYLWNALDTFLCCKFLLAATGSYRLARFLRLSPPAAVVTMAVFALSSYFLLYLNQPHTNAESLLPWVLFAVAAYLHRGGVGRLAAGAVAVACLVLGGHPEATFYGLLLAGLFGVHEAFVAGRARVPAGRRWVGLPGLFLLGLALGAVQLLPFLEYLPRAWHIHAPGVGALHRGPLGVLEGLVPRLKATGSYDTPFGVGAAALLLAGYALAGLRRWRARGLFLGGYALVFLGLSLGLPPFTALAHLPWVGEAGNLKYPAPTVILCVAVLAGLGLDRLGRRGAHGAAGGFLRAGAAVALLTAALPALLRLFLRLPLDLGAALLMAALVGASLPWVQAAAAGRLRPGVLPVATGSAVTGSLLVSQAGFGGGKALLLSALVLLAGGAAYLAARRPWAHRGAFLLASAPFLIPAAVYVATDRAAGPPRGGRPLPDPEAPPPVVRALRRLIAATGGGPCRITGEPWALPANQPTVYGLEDVRSFDALYVDRFMQYLNVVNGVRDYRETLLPFPAGITAAAALERLWASNTDWRLFEETKRCRIRVERFTHPLVDLLGVRFFVFSPLFPAERLPKAPHLEMVYEEHGFRILWNRRAAPRAFLVRQVRRCRDWRAVRAALAEPSFDGRRQALLEGPLPGPLPDRPLGPEEGVRVLAHTTHAVRLQVRLTAPAVVVLTENYYPGWEAMASGPGGRRTLRLFPVDLAFRGFYLPRGVWTVELRYRPRSVLLGAALGAAALALLLFLALGAHWPRKRA